MQFKKTNLSDSKYFLAVFYRQANTQNAPVGKPKKLLYI